MPMAAIIGVVGYISCGCGIAAAAASATAVAATLKMAVVDTGSLALKRNKYY